MLGIILSQQQVTVGFLVPKDSQNQSTACEPQWDMLSGDLKDGLPNLLTSIVDQVRQSQHFEGTGISPCPVLMFIDQNGQVDALDNNLKEWWSDASLKDFRLIHIGDIAWAYVSGSEGDIQRGKKGLVLERTEDRAYWHELDHLEIEDQTEGEESDVSELFKHERLISTTLPEMDKTSGEKKVLSTLMKRFLQAGFQPEETGRLALTEQIHDNPFSGRFTLTREFDQVSIQAETRMSEEAVAELMLGDFEALRPRLKKQKLIAEGISSLYLMGETLYHPRFLSFLRSECGWTSGLYLAGSGSHQDMIASCLQGIAARAAMIQEADAKRLESLTKQAEAEKKQAEIAAEIQMKDQRTSLLQEIHMICVDPEKKESYEQQFIDLGDRLGIPEAVIKWNISEVLNRIKLEQEREQIGLEWGGNPTSASKEPVILMGKRMAQSGTRLDSGIRATSKDQISEKDLVRPVRKASQKRVRVALADIFAFKGELADVEFISRKATFHQDHDLKVVRILPADRVGNPLEEAAFRRVYHRERSYFEAVSEISESKDGMYFYRKFINLGTLKEYASKNGLAGKKSVEDFNSAELKVILTLLKAAQELPVEHGALTPDNILIGNKRKWNLTKELDVKFVGFHSAEGHKNLEQAHEALSQVIGQNVYKEFKERVQL